MKHRIELHLPERAQLGKLVPPYPVERCALNDCESRFESGAFLYRDLESESLVVLCDGCARYVELEHCERFALIAL